MIHDPKALHAVMVKDQEVWQKGLEPSKYAFRVSVPRSHLPIAILLTVTSPFYSVQVCCQRAGTNTGGRGNSSTQSSLLRISET